jgi:hypothetical protein
MSNPLRAVEIHLPVVSHNVLRRKYRNPHAYRKLRNDYGWALKAANAASKLGQATGPRRVLIIRLMGKGAQRFDPDNLAGGAKPLVDELVTLGVLIDDTDAAATITYSQRKTGATGTRIEVEDLETTGGP